MNILGNYLVLDDNVVYGLSTFSLPNVTLIAVVVTVFSILSYACIPFPLHHNYTSVQSPQLYYLSGKVQEQNYYCAKIILGI